MRPVDDALADHSAARGRAGRVRGRPEARGDHAARSAGLGRGVATATTEVRVKVALGLGAALMGAAACGGQSTAGDTTTTTTATEAVAPDASFPVQYAVDELTGADDGVPSKPGHLHDGHLFASQAAAAALSVRRGPSHRDPRALRGGRGRVRQLRRQDSAVPLVPLRAPHGRDVRLPGLHARGPQRPPQRARLRAARRRAGGLRQRHRRLPKLPRRGVHLRRSLAEGVLLHEGGQRRVQGHRRRGRCHLRKTPGGSAPSA